MKEIAIIGGNISGITTTFLLQDEYDPSEVILLEKKPIRSTTPPMYAVMAASILEKMLNQFGIDSAIEPFIYDLTQIHDVEGKVVLEFQTPLSIVDLPSFREKFSCIIDTNYIVDRAEVISYREVNEQKRKLSVRNQHIDIIETNNIIDASGFDWFYTKEAMRIEEYIPFKHNFFTFYQAIIETSRIPIEREALHISFNEYATPGGFSILFSTNSDRLWVLGFYNKFLTHKTPIESVNTVKNALGIVGRVSQIRSKEIFLGRPLLQISPQNNIFLVGASNLSVYPVLVSGAIYNIFTTQEVVKFLLKLLDSQRTPKEISFELNSYYTKTLFPISEIFDAFRVLLLTVRREILEDFITLSLEILETIFRSPPTDIGIELIQMLIRLISSPKVSKKILTILRSVYELLEAFKSKSDEDTDSWMPFVRLFSTKYSKQVTQLVPISLAKEFHLD